MAEPANWRLAAPPAWGERPTVVVVQRSLAQQHHVFMVDLERRYLLMSETEGWALWAVLTEAMYSIGDPPAWELETVPGNQVVSGLVPSIP
ncbi:hypothetical protein [Longispora fulva]|uniref:Uncharacterized protein n=1 Tax=Longispora fulva TaxID=619741 RepID=A0A8J7KQD5_9ACTN|nr:hypothetical protein [Longispora fulva]MBG6137277.1 hypothetical protein [Longispora fulva]